MKKKLLCKTCTRNKIKQQVVIAEELNKHRKSKSTFDEIIQCIDESSSDSENQKYVSRKSSKESSESSCNED